MLNTVVVPNVSTTITTILKQHTATITSSHHIWSVRPWIEAEKVPNAPLGPDTDEMKAALTSYLLENHPEQLASAVEKSFLREGFQLIFTPPYMPKFQPIEMLWNHVKGYLAQTFENGRTMQNVKELLHLAFIGATEPLYAKVDCLKLVEHAHKDMSDWATRDADLMITGCDVKTIRYASPVDVGNALSAAQLHAQVAADAEAEQSVQDAVEDDDEEMDVNV